MLPLILEHFPELIYFRSYHNAAIRIISFFVLQLLLVIILSGIEFSKRGDLGYNWFVESTTFIQFSFILFSFCFLFRIMIKNGATVLCSFISALPVERGRVMRFPKNFQQFIK